MRTIFATAREPALAEIKLAWWQERLGAFGDGDAPAEPLLRQLGALVAEGRMAANDLAELASAWRELFGEAPLEVAALDAYARARGRGLVAVAASALGGVGGEAQLQAGEAWALFDLAACLPAGADRTRIAAAARARFLAAERSVWPRALRPLGMIFALARADALSGATPRQGAPKRVMRMAWHALSGR